MSVTLKNMSRRCQVFILAHETYCQALGSCACTIEIGRRARRIPSSLTVAAGVVIEGLPDATLAVPGVERGVRCGELSVTRTSPEPSPDVEPDPPLPSSDASAELPLEGGKKKRGSP